MQILQSGVHVVVGTPGRVHDMIQRRALRTDAIKIFVMDEADEMLSVVFVYLKCLLMAIIEGFQGSNV